MAVDSITEFLNAHDIKPSYQRMIKVSKLSFSNSTM